MISAVGLRAASAAVLPPGAAQQSSRREPVPTSAATSCEASSWMKTRPSRNARVRVTSPPMTMRALASSAPGASSMPSLASSCSISALSRRMAVFGMRWSCWQIANARSTPNSATQRFTSHSGCANSRVKNGIGSPTIVSGGGSIFASAIFRSTAFANGAADRFCARFTSSTLSLMAARAGTRVRNCNLISRQPQRVQHLGIELVQRTRRCRGDRLIQPRAPAQHAHDELGRQSAIGGAELVEPLRVQQFAGVGVCCSTRSRMSKAAARAGETGIVSYCRCAQRLVTSRPVAVDEIPRAHPLLALGCSSCTSRAVPCAKPSSRRSFSIAK